MCLALVSLELSAQVLDLLLDIVLSTQDVGGLCGPYQCCRLQYRLQVLCHLSVLLGYRGPESLNLPLEASIFDPLASLYHTSIFALLAIEVDDDRCVSGVVKAHMHHAPPLLNENHSAFLKLPLAVRVYDFSV
jgi:hypothetical protein